MTPLGIGAIGCGMRLNTLLNIFPGLGQDLALEAVCDPDPEAVRRMREKYNPQARAYEDYRALVADPRVQWVFIGSWNRFHREHAVAALKAGKHVFCEKPLATTFDDCLAMRDAWRKSGRSFAIGFTLRYSPHYRKIHELVASCAIGKIMSMEFNENLDFNLGGYIHSGWRRRIENAGNYLLEKCCHDIDLAHWIVGSLPVRAASFGGCDFLIPENAHRLDELKPASWGGLPYRIIQGPGGLDCFRADKDIVDNQVAILQFRNGVRAMFHSNCNAAIPERRMLILGTHGAIRADVITGAIELCRIGFDEPVERLDTADGRGGHGGGDEYLVGQIRNCMMNGAAPDAGLEDGLRAAVTCFGIDEALRTGQVANLTPLWARADIDPAQP